METTGLAIAHKQSDIIAEAELQFTDNSIIGSGMCSCVCIADEQCCGCLLQ